MANQLYAGFLYDDAGDPIVGATVNLYDRNTTTPVRATTTTDANGYWAISHATEGRFDVEIVNGSTKRRRKYDDSVQLETIEAAALRLRNPADTFDYNLVPAAITADRQLNLPLITATDTLASLGLAQTFTAEQTYDADQNFLRSFAEVVVADAANTDVVSARALAAQTYEVWEIVASENNGLRSWHTVMVFRRSTTAIQGVVIEDYDSPAGVTVTVADNGDSTYDINYNNATGGGLGRTVTGRLLRQVNIA